MSGERFQHLAAEKTILNDRLGGRFCGFRSRGRIGAIIGCYRSQLISKRYLRITTIECIKEPEMKSVFYRSDWLGVFFCLGLPAYAQLLVTDNFGTQVVRYDAVTGDFVDVLITSQPQDNGGLNGPIGCHRRQRRLLVASPNTDSILCYHLDSGEFLANRFGKTWHAFAGPAKISSDLTAIFTWPISSEDRFIESVPIEPPGPVY